jgi:hypothetical protein
MPPTKLQRSMVDIDNSHRRGAPPAKALPMQRYTQEGLNALNDIASRYGMSFDAIEHLLNALLAGQTTQAQFNHPELGGMGQWSQGGMIMIGDMFNNGLKGRIDSLCNELAGLIRSANLHLPPAPVQSQSQFQGNGSSGVSLFVPGGNAYGNWWPDDLGQAASVGAQNDLRYAFFPMRHRLAINVGGRVTVYDTRDHQIGGFSQQQGGDQSLTFTSQYGLVRVSDLEVVTPGSEAAAVPISTADTGLDYASPDNPPPAPPAPPAPMPQSAPPIPPVATANDDDIFAKIERLAGLHAKGILTDEEFGAKKTELLGRL